MNFQEFDKILHFCFKENGIDKMLDAENAQKLYKFAGLLTETNKQMNLTAITDVEGVVFKHFADCAMVSQYIPAGKSVIDVGCGAGFPSFPLAILRPDLNVTALDSTSKKILFIQNCAKDIGVSNIHAISARAEEFACDNRERFDIATSRAVARLNVLCELCLPLVKVGGKFVPMKASKAQEELDEARNGIKTLGARHASTHEYLLTYDQEKLQRYIFEIEKTSHTDTKYPRKYAQMLKKPL